MLVFMLLTICMQKRSAKTWRMIFFYLLEKIERKGDDTLKMVEMLRKKRVVKNTTVDANVLK